jgi:excinuclease ABC subunit C
MAQDPTQPDQPTTPEDGSGGRERLLAKARDLARVPGVYLMKDPAGVVLYVGKAVSLPDRVGSYFLPSTDLGPRKQPMLELVADFDVIPCEGEWEALLLEARLVKDLKPRFNASLRDDKTFPYLAVTIRDEFPGVYITRDPAHERFRGARLYGPFTSGSSLRQAVQLLQRVFQYRTCELDIRSEDPANRGFRPCLLFKIDQCTAPCANRISPDRYRQDIERFCRFLESRRSTMLREMRQEMEQASTERRYEAAAVLRDQIHAIEKLDERERRGFEGIYDWQPEVTISAQDPRAGCRSLQRVLGIEREVRVVEAVDIAHLGGGETVGSLVCFVDGRPFRDRYRRFRIRSAGNDDFAAIREVVGRRFRSPDPDGLPDVLLIDGGVGQLGAAIEALEGAGSRPSAVLSLSKKEELIHLPQDPEPLRLSRNHSGLQLCQAIRDEAHRFAQHYHHLLRRRRFLKEGERREGGSDATPHDDVR